MRPGHNKRLRGRNNNNNHGRKGPNPLTRSFESNGPDVKIRGTAQHVAEKYLQLARDAQTSGDPVMAENYLQHAEHYYRVIAAAQQAQQQAMGLLPKPPQEIEEEDDGIEEDDRFASVADRLPQPPQMQTPQNFSSGQSAPVPQPYQGQPNNGGGQPYGERQQYGGGQRPWRDNRNDNRGERPDSRGERQDTRGERQEFRGERQDFRGERQDFRGERQDFRSDRNESRGNDNRGGDGRSEQRFDNRPEGGERNDRQGQPWRNERRGPRPESVDAAPEGGLPSFITGSRPPAVEGAAGGEQQEFPGIDNAEGQQGYHLRPRRRRRGRPGSANEGELNSSDGDAAGNEDSVPASE